MGYINATDPDLGPEVNSLIPYPQKRISSTFQIMDDGAYFHRDIFRLRISEHLQISRVRRGQWDSISKQYSKRCDEVRDCNDNAPYFTFPGMNPFSLNVDYHPYHPNNITVLKASDSDSRENAFLKYKIASGNDKQLFSLNQYTGLLFLQT